METVVKIVDSLPLPRRFKKSWLKLQNEAENFLLESSIEGNFSQSWLPAEEVVEFLFENYFFSDDLPIKLLDVGCGGLAEPQYHKAIKSRIKVEIFGIDPFSGESVRFFVFKQSISEKIPFSDNKFDLVLVISSLDHSVHPKLALSEIHRVCKVGGLVLFCETTRDVNRTYLKWKIKSFFGIFPARFNKFHNWAWTENTLSSLISTLFEIKCIQRSNSEPSELFVLGKKHA